ncbi:MAG TPA: hypothetical protein VH724_19855 [Candidatus Angelobacter sp.]|jgi:hypothetical protein|nr:hypothetical protein [Candidatus Angelobacter sp.]
MNYKLIHLLLCTFLIPAVVQAEGPKNHSRSNKVADDATKAHKVDPCTLLTSAEIQSVQGEAMEEARPSTQPGNGVVMSQCFFRTSTPSKSVSLAVATPTPLQPRTFWLKQFHPRQAKTEEERTAAQTAKKPVAKREEDDETTKPRAIAGLGEEAYWVGGPMIGALYVLRGNTFFRISVGGVREEAKRIEKSVILARAVLKRM